MSRSKDSSQFPEESKNQSGKNDENGIDSNAPSGIFLQVNKISDDSDNQSDINQSEDKTSNKSDNKENKSRKNSNATSTKTKKSEKTLSEKVLYIDIDEEITSLIDRVKKIKADRVYLVLPKRAVLMQSIVNLKILAHEASKLGKEISLVTGDKKGGSLASQVGLTVYQDLRSTGLKGTHRIENKPVIPIKATLGKSKEKKPQLKTNKKSLQDLVKTKSKSFGGSPENAGFSVKNISEKLMPKSKTPDGKQMIDTSSFMISAPNKRILGLFVGLSVVVLILIAYFVLPKAEITTEMASQTQTPVERVILADASANEAELKIYNDNIIASYPIETEIELTKTYNASGYDSVGTDSRGEIIIFNDSSKEQGLIATTRFRSSDGIIFRLQNAVQVPANGTVTGFVVADKLDESGQVVGDRGNLGPSTFSVPGLTGSNKDLIYGKNIEPFSGGTTAAVKIVTQEDIDAAKSNIVEILKKSATGKLIERISGENAANNTNFWLLMNDEALDISVLSVKVFDSIKAGDRVDTFDVFAKIKVSGVMFNKEEMIQILDRRLRADLHPDMKIAYADKDSLTIDYVDYDAREDKIKLNVSMSYRLEYEMSDTLSASIKNTIVGLSADDAKEYIQSLPEVSEAHIVTWPIWVHSIPGVTGNIEIIVTTVE